MSDWSSSSEDEELEKHLVEREGEEGEGQNVIRSSSSGTTSQSHLNAQSNLNLVEELDEDFFIAMSSALNQTGTPGDSCGHTNSCGPAGGCGDEGCSTGSSASRAFVDLEGEHLDDSPVGLVDTLPPCLKCGELKAQFVARQRQPMCRQCMEESIVCKVKTAVFQPSLRRSQAKSAGTSKTIGAGDTIAVACSGGFNSLALLHILNALAKEHAQRYRPRIKDDLKVVHIVTGDDWHAVERLRESVSGIDSGIEFIAVPLRFVLEKEEALFRYLHDRHSLDSDAEMSGGFGELNDLEALVEGCSSNSGARSDMGTRLVKLLCLRVAKMIGCTKVALGCNATFFATHIIASILKGSGFALPADVNYIDQRPSASGLPDILHPLRDCVSKELLLMCYLHNIEFTHDPKDIAGDRRNIRSICKDFVYEQQDRLSSTVNTVVRTASKIDYNGIKEEAMKVLDPQGRIKEDKMCHLCSAPMCNSSKDFILSQQEQQSGVAGGLSRDNICYSCCMVFENLDSNFKFWSLEDNQKSMKNYFCRGNYNVDDIEEVRPIPVGGAPSSDSQPGPARSTRGMKCAYCKVNRAMLKRPKTKECVCKECFYYAFEEEIHKTIVHEKIFTPGDRVAIGASGGKDSTVLIHTLKTLNERHNYGIELFLLSVDEGIKGYRDDSLETVARNEQQYGIPLEVVSYKDLYGYSMDDIVAQIGLKNNCTFCGVFRRQALDRGAVLLKANKIVTGHNADDIAETVFLNVLRGDFPRLTRCTNSITGEDSALPRCKPFKYTYEKEIVMYAFHKKLDYFATECTYSPQAYRGFTREFIKDVEIINPTGILNTIVSADEMKLGTDTDKPLQVQGECQRCGYITSQEVCKACVLLEGLRKGNPRFGISKASSKASKPLSQRGG